MEGRILGLLRHRWSQQRPHRSHQRNHRTRQTHRQRLPQPHQLQTPNAPHRRRPRCLHPHSTLKSHQSILVPQPLARTARRDRTHRGQRGSLPISFWNHAYPLRGRRLKQDSTLGLGWCCWRFVKRGCPSVTVRYLLWEIVGVIRLFIRLCRRNRGDPAHPLHRLRSLLPGPSAG